MLGYFDIENGLCNCGFVLLLLAIVLGGLRRERSENISVGAVGITIWWTLGVTAAVSLVLPLIVEDGRLGCDYFRCPRDILLLLPDHRKPGLDVDRAGILLLLSDLVTLLARDLFLEWGLMLSN